MINNCCFVICGPKLSIFFQQFTNYYSNTDKTINKARHAAADNITQNRGDSLQ